MGGSSSNCQLGCGTLFQLNLQGTLSTLHNFCSSLGCADGSSPAGNLVQGTDGDFYGTTQLGGLHANGGVFKVSSSGSFVALYSFCAQANCGDGAQPYAGLVQATDGNFYGTATAGGTGSVMVCENNNNAPGCGTVFKITPSGVVTTIHNFCLQTGCTDGANPYGALVQGTDGYLYGTTFAGGANQLGTVYRISLAGDFAVVASFIANSGPNTGGATFSGVIQGSDGNFYGSTYLGGDGGGGTIYMATPEGVLTVLHAFDGADGGGSRANLLQASNGTFYGTAGGGQNGEGVIFSLSGPAPTAAQFVPVTPCRLVDTRQNGGAPIQGGTWQTFTLPTLGGCNIPATATAYSLNVTVIPQGRLGYLTIWPTGRSQPGVSTMNSTDGRVKANAAIVPAGSSGAVNVFASNTTNVLLDIDGYFTTPGAGTYQFYPLTPCRIIDTRNGNGGPLQAGVERDYLISGNCGVPAGAIAYSFNVTALPTQGSLDYLTVWPQGEPQPTVSTLNDNTGTNVANAAIVPAGSAGTTAFYAHNHDTNLLLDVNGYFAAPAVGGLSMYAVAPCRVLDTRQNNGQPFQGQRPVDVVDSSCAPSASAQGYVFNATVVPPGPMGYLSLWPDGEQQPTVSTLNALDGFITSNMAIVPNSNGSIDAYASALTHLLLDISGYFAP
jgi:uncharacterized repeat protein (TIGR03803 family)